MLSNAYGHIMWTQQIKDYYTSEFMVTTCPEIKLNALPIVCNRGFSEIHKTDVMIMDGNFSS